ncbi:MAG TPA: PAS domain-containing sensor histidine kinase, partial [Massilia sp.]|nr:PAS domain-containing sensor histidine kinase [Massilia sp.]
RHKDGHDVITMVYAAPLVDAAGVHRGWMSSVVDITAQKQAEARQREQDLRLQRSARLASVGEMASTLAHELNQPLMA